MRALLVLATALFAVPALAAEVVEVRVGNHPTFTRVVFELNAPAGYRIERRTEGGATEILVTMEAGSTPRSVMKRTEMVERVAVQDGRTRSVAHIRLKQQPSRVKEMILANPPRLVFDLVLPEAKLAAIRARAAAKKAEAAKAEAAKAEASKTAQAKPAPTPRTVTAKAPEPPKAKPAPKPQPQPKAEPKPAPKPVAKTTPAPAPAPKPAPKVAPKPAPKPAVVARTEPPKPKAEPKPAPMAATKPAPKPAPKVAPVPVAKPEPQVAKPPIIEVQPDKAEIVDTKPTAKPEPAKPTVKPAPRPAPKPVAKKPGVSPAPTAPAGDSLLANLDWTLWGGAAAGVLLFVIVLVLWLRRRSLPNDMDVTALAEEAGADGEPSSISEFAFGADGPTVSEKFSSSIDLPESKSSDGPAFTAGPGMDDEPEKENEMDSETPDLPLDRTSSEMPTQVGVGGAAAGGDVGRVLGELERRVAQMEARLDESIDARERLERQVAAQAEELRVQRAAIARTQRALRSLNRGEEEQATEPAIREPSS